jgi:hypothetical protein
LPLPSAAYAADDGEPRLPPAPQWRVSPDALRRAAPAPDVPASGENPSRGVPSFEAAESILPAEPRSFAARCADLAVVLCDPLDEGRVSGVGIGADTANATLPEAVNGRYGDWRWCSFVPGVSPSTPAYDPTTKASGSGSLKFTIPTRSKDADAGYCQVNFTPDNAIQFGEGETFFVQFRVRFSCSLLFVDCDPASAGYKKQRRVFRSKSKGTTHFKVSIVNAGDHAALKYPVNSCTEQHLVLVQAGGGIVAGYHSCGWYDGHERPVGRAQGSELWDRQPKKAADRSRACIVGRGTTSPACVQWPADEWVTVTQQVTIGRWVRSVSDRSRSSNVRIWTQRQGEKPVLVIDYDRNLRAPEKPMMKYGKIWLLPFMTDKDPTEDHPEAYMWFDELIVSRGPIAPASD